MCLHAVIVLLLTTGVDYSEQSLSASPDIQYFKASAATEDNECPLWEEKNNSTGDCVCGSELRGLVICKEHPYELQLYSCFCMTYHEENQSLVGPCQYTCRRSENYFYTIAVNSTYQLNHFMCSPFKRQGQLCGSCEPGHAPPAYSYYPTCVNCTATNWARYTAVSLLPVTAFFIFAMIIRLSATSPKLNCFILCTQILLFSSNIRAFAMTPQNKLSYTMSSWFGIWNLDFLRLVYTPFCLHPHTKNLHILALDYLIAVYPLLLIALSFLLVVLYDRDVKLIVCLWRPLVPILIKFRREWNIRNSLLEAFTTFFLLSYVKILSVSVDLLLPVLLYNKHGHTIGQVYVYNQGDIPYLGSEHLHFAILALTFLLTFTLLPMLLLFLYPCSCFQRCLNRTGRKWQPLHTFMDAFQGHYRNGTDGTPDLRYFAGIYLLLRIVVYASTVVIYLTTSYAYTAAIIAVTAVGVALARPYKKHIYNIIDTCLLITVALLYVTLVPQLLLQPPRKEGYLSLINAVLVAFLVLYIPAVSISWLVSLKRIFRWYKKLQLKLRGILEKSFSDRLVNRADYETLLPVSQDEKL